MAILETNLKDRADNLPDALGKICNIVNVHSKTKWPSLDEERKAEAKFWDAPNFRWKNNRIISNQLEYTEVFVLSKVLNGFCLAVDQFPGAVFLKQQDHNQLALFCHYSSLYHAVNSFLALNGIVYVPYPFGDTVMTTGARTIVFGKKIKFTLEKFKRQNGNSEIDCLRGQFKFIRSKGRKEWFFEGRNLKHRTRWLEFSNLLCEMVDKDGIGSLPNSIRKVFEIIIPYEAYYANRKLSPANVADLKFLVEKSCEKFLEFRHSAIYRNKVLDDFLLRISKELKKSGIVNPSKIALTYLSQFNKAILKWQASNIKELFQSIEQKMNSEKNALIDGLRYVFEFADVSEVNFNRAIRDKLINYVSNDIPYLFSSWRKMKLI